MRSKSLGYAMFGFGIVDATRGLADDGWGGWALYGLGFVLIWWGSWILGEEAREWKAVAKRRIGPSIWIPDIDPDDTT